LWKRNQIVILCFFRTFPFDRIHKATKDVNVHFFIHSNDSCKVYQWIPGTFWSYYVILTHFIRHSFSRNTRIVPSWTGFTDKLT
jgi:hypothetical protein